ncbi:hypothetical protein LI328DRAFT_169763 [Trichoderma asperelloides]|nr:hypothetical protein LI328DRAFT_169763 [Trichoderma asperelloides]
MIKSVRGRERERARLLSRSRAYFPRPVPYRSATTAAWLPLVALWLCIKPQTLLPPPPSGCENAKFLQPNFDRVFHNSGAHGVRPSRLDKSLLGRALHCDLTLGRLQCVNQPPLTSQTDGYHQLCVSSLSAPSPVGSSTG